MTKYKRWILLLTALTAFVVHVESLRATSLIHSGKFSKLLNTSTTTTSTTAQPSGDKQQKILDDAADDESYVEVNGTKIALTGIPQIDYVWDPNLPRELNGFNLSTYPFLDSMPAEEDIGFNCDGKINGFYASIKYSCQLYHHCLYGVRSDFICANFTGFDQKTFICHFVSEVDCKNSYKYWSRNDELYKATTEKSTTSQAGLLPLFDRNLYKRPAPGSANNAGHSKKEYSADSAITAAPIPNSGIASIQKLKLHGLNPSNDAPQAPSRNNNRNEDYIDTPGNQRPAGNRPMRRPYRRRRPQVDYYYYDDDYEEDFYDDRGRRRQRPRNRRPIYDDYDNRRPDRRPTEDFDDYEYERRPYRNRNRSESRRNGDGDRRKLEDRRFDDRRRPYNDERRQDDRRRPLDDERRSYDDRKLPEDRRTNEDRRTLDEPKIVDEDNDKAEDKKITRRRNNEEPVTEHTEKRQIATTTEEAELPLKPPAFLFERPRPLSPKISRPSSLVEKSKYAYEPPKKAPEELKKDEEYYEDDYYEAASAPASVSSPKSTTKTTKTTTTSTTTPRSSSVITKYSPRLKTPTTPLTPKKSTTTTTTTAVYQEYYDDDYEEAVTQATTAKPKDTSQSLFSRSQQLPDSFRHNRFKSSINESTTQKAAEEHQRKTLPSAKKFASKQTLFDQTTEDSSSATVPGIDVRFRNDQQTPVAEVAEERNQKYSMKIIKRPFLPSRGGNPYKGRGLQPVGPASLDTSQFSSPASAPGIDVRGNFQPEPSTQHRTTLEDIYNEEYDVELNDALNPMLKPLTSSRGISGFAFSSLANVQNVDRDVHRSQSQKSIQKAVAPKTSTTTTTEPPQYEYEEYEEYDE